MEFHGSKIPACNDDINVMTSLMLTMVTFVSLFECSITYALQCLGYEPMTLKAEQRVPVKYVCEGKKVFLWLPTAFGKLLCYEALPFVFDVMQCSVSLHHLTVEVHQVLCFSL